VPSKQALEHFFSPVPSPHLHSGSFPAQETAVELQLLPLSQKTLATAVIEEAWAQVRTQFSVGLQVLVLLLLEETLGLLPEEEVLHVRVQTGVADDGIAAENDASLFLLKRSYYNDRAREGRR
jgi:hypothetical protein